MNPLTKLINDPNVSEGLKDAICPADYSEDPLTRNEIENDACLQAYLNCENYDDYIERTTQAGVDPLDAETWWNEEQTKHQER